jgi:glycosyltransferase involved in cell wall biosynthesis
MKVQIYSYLDLPNGSICNVAYRWYIELSNHFIVRFMPLGAHRIDAFPEVDIGELDNPDVIIVIGYPSLWTKIDEGKVAKARKRIGVFVSDTNLTGPEAFHLKSKKIRWDMICVPSEYCRSLFVPHFGNSNKLMVVHHGIAPAFYPRSVGKESLRTYLTVYHQSPAGGTYIRKNIQGVAEAFRALQEKYKSVQLIIKSSIYENCTIPKDVDGIPNISVSHLPLTNDEMACLYSRCHAYVTGTLSEGFGLTPLEAMACGINVISPVHSGLKEYLSPTNCIEIPHARNGIMFGYAMNYGRLFKVKTEDIFAAMERDYLGRHDLCPMSLSNWARENFSWNKVIYAIRCWMSS